MDDTAARAIAQSILAPGETLHWWQAAPPMTIAGPAIFGGIVCLVIFHFSRKIRPPPKENGAARYWAIRIIIPIWLLMLAAGAAAGVVQTVSAWSTAYAITSTRVVIVSNFPWTWQRSFGAEAFTRYGISGDAIEFDWYSNGARSRASYHARIAGLYNPQRVAHIIKEHVAPEAQRIDYQP